MAVSTKKLRSSVVLVGAPAQGTGGGAGSPFTGVAPEGTSPGAGRTICALLPRHGPGSAGPAGDGTPVRPGTGPEGRPCRMWCSLLSVIARSSRRRSVTGGGVRRTAGGDDTDTGAPRACSKRRPSMVRIRRSAGMGWVRRGERPAAPNMSPWYRLLPITVVLRSGLTGSAPRLEVFSCQTGSGNGPSCGEAVAAGSARVASRLGLQRSNAGP